MALESIELVILVLTGLAAGVLGGLLGLGGSLIMIPAMAVLFASKPFASQHLYQASAMVVNVAVAVPAVLTHARKGAFRFDVFKRMVIWMTCGIMMGVLLSDLFAGWALQYLFAVFLVYTGSMTLISVLRSKETTPHSEQELQTERISMLRCTCVGASVGVLAGLLGIGGGALFVPLCISICALSLKHAIGVSAALMCVSAVAGSALKIIRLETHGVEASMALQMALILAPSSIVGSMIGARLTHVLPTKQLKLIFAITLLLVAIKLVDTAQRSRAESLRDAEKTIISDDATRHVLEQN